MEQVKLRRPRSITGQFRYSQIEPVFDTARGKRVSTVESQCELNCDTGSLSMYGLSSRAEKKTPFLIIPKIWKVTRNKHDKKYFCLEYGTETVRFSIFLTIRNESDADDWEDELCRITGQTPPRRHRLTTVYPPKPLKRLNKDTLSGPVGFDGFNPDENEGHSRRGEEEDLDDVPAEGDDSDGTEDDEQNDGTLPTSQSGSQEGETSTLESIRVSSSDGQQEAEETAAPDDPQETRPRDGQRSPVENFCSFDEAEQGVSNGGIPSDIRPLSSLDQPPSHQLPGELRSTEVTSQHVQCTHLEIEFSQDKSTVEVNKEDLKEEEIRDIFVFYKGSLYLKSCPGNLRRELFIGTRILQVNNQVPSCVEKAFDYIKSSAGEKVTFTVQLFPLGVRVRLGVASLADLGIELRGNEITDWSCNGVLSKMADGLRSMSPALSTPDTPHAMYVEQRSITAIGNRHVRHDASTDVVKSMLEDEISSGSKHLVLQLHPTNFCYSLAHPESRLNRTATRRPSLARIHMSNH